MFELHQKYRYVFLVFFLQVAAEKKTSFLVQLKYTKRCKKNSRNEYKSNIYFIIILDHEIFYVMKNK